MDDLLQKFSAHLDLYLSADVKVDTFYHYTTVEALINGIILEKPSEGKEVCLRATHNSFLNDPQELKCGINVLADILTYLDKSQTYEDCMARAARKFRNLYIISFSEKEDFLPMWNTYSKKSTGVAIGFKRLKTIGSADYVLKCIYGVDSLYDKVHELDEQEKLGLLHVEYLAQALKHKAYSYEEEIRLIGRFFDSPIKFREKNGYIIPYKEVFFAKEQIKSITLGPCQNMDNAEYSLRQFLDSRGFEHVKIDKSSIPYRNM